MDALGKDTRNQTRTGQLYKRQINKSSDVYKCSNLSSQDQGDKRTQTHAHTHTPVDSTNSHTLPYSHPLENTGNIVIYMHT